MLLPQLFQWIIKRDDFEMKYLYLSIAGVMTLLMVVASFVPEGKAPDPEPEDETATERSSVEDDAAAI